MTTRGPTRRWSLNYPKIFQNRCILCGRIIPAGYSVCANCNRKKKFFR